jgi:ketosteroid isomerase-like protein
MHPREAFRKAVEARDLDDMMAPFAEDAVLHSPITFQPFEGRAAIRQLLGILIEVFQDFRYTDELESGDGQTKALVFRARAGHRELEGIDLIRFDAEGRICDFTVFIRPRSAIEELLAQVAPRLARARGGA